MGSPPRKNFHAVSVVSKADACTAAQALKDVKLLATDAPRLPLDDCNQPAACSCKFRHHDDRRVDLRRAVDFTNSASRQFVSLERRQRRGRRASDFDEDV
jgi:hypothetical protein